MAFQSPQLGVLLWSLSRSAIDLSIPWFSRTSGTLYIEGASWQEITQFCSTLAKSEILRLASSLSGVLHLTARISGWIPILLSSCTLCWVGFVFCSPTTSSTGANVTWMKSVFEWPSSSSICLNASRNGKLSMSPTVPPHSTTKMSSFSSFATLHTAFFIASVTCGIIWTHWPKYFPSRSALMTSM